MRTMNRKTIAGLAVTALVALPLSDTNVPKSGLASTLTQGAGVICAADTVMTYSHPSEVKPPRPLKANSSRVCGERAAIEAATVAASPTRRGRDAGIVAAALLLEAFA